MSSKAAKKEEFSFPSGGIADFYMEDHEIEALEREEALEAFGNSGIANFQEISNRMASYGRYGDDTVAHVETGELVIPKALIEDNPKLRDSIFSHLEEMGVEDPERYVVGSGANSINPDTGLPEFFFKSIKKAISKIGKGVSKSLNKIGKVIKKAAPIILPIALAMTPLGPIYGAALGSGIGTLASGGNLQDAFKSALVAGGTGALFTGFTGSGTFSQNVGKALSSPGARLGQTLSGARSTLSGSGFTGEGNLFSEFTPTTTASEQLAEVTAGTEIPSAEAQFQGQYADAGTTAIDGAPKQLQVGEPLQRGTEAGNFLEQQARAAELAGQTTTTGPMDVGLQDIPSSTTDVSTVLTDKIPPQGTGDGFLKTAGEYMDTAGDYLFRGGQSASDIAANQSLAKTTAINDYLKPFGKTLETIGDAPLAVQQAAIAAGDAAAAAAGPGLITTYGPSAALTGAGLYAGGFFDAPPEDDPSQDMGPTGAELLAANPDKYTVGGGTPTLSSGPYTVATNYQYQPRSPFVPYNPFAFIQQAAEGGEIFPRRVGGIMPNEGVPGKDSVRAMLMPGEFVMTTDAVKGLGNGNNEVGINRMYDLMRGLDAKGKAMA